MPLNAFATFKAKLTRRNQIQVPQFLRWRYKMEGGELLKVKVKVCNSTAFRTESFLAKMAIDGRLTVPRLIMEILEQGERRNLAGDILDVTLEPVGRLSNGLS